MPLLLCSGLPSHPDIPLSELWPNQAGSHTAQTISGAQAVDDSGIRRAGLAQYGTEAHTVDGVAAWGGTDAYGKDGPFF
jgi:hypothetical protein